MTNLSRTTTTDLVDMLGQIKAEKADLAARERVIKNLLASRGGDHWIGRLFEVTMSYRQRAVLDAARIRAMFKATGASLPEKVSTSTNWDVRARKVEAA